ANWYVKLSDVAPDGSVTLITGAGLNGTHRNSAEHPEFLEVNKQYHLAIPLHFTSWIFEPGHKIRVSVTNALWPMFWPTPYNMTTTLLFGENTGSKITLPLVPLSSLTEADKAAAYMGSRNISSKDENMEIIRDSAAMQGWPGAATIVRDELKGISTVSYKIDYKTEELITKITVAFTVQDEHPAEASMKATIEMALTNNGHLTVWKGITEINSDSSYFHYHHDRKLYRDGAIARQKEWKEDVKRDFQ
ncbi:MAG: CocE/NonD family hydrolase C-terminal non-catalytic domain-containing protein, partial [Bacteroidota bacterium]